VATINPEDSKWNGQQWWTSQGFGDHLREALTSCGGAAATAPHVNLSDSVCEMEGGPLDGNYFIIDNRAKRVFFPIALEKFKETGTECAGLRHSEYRRTGPKRFSYYDEDMAAEIGFLMFDMEQKIKSGWKPE